MGKVVLGPWAYLLDTSVSKCNSCAHDGVPGASYDMDACYGCTTQGLDNWKEKEELYPLGYFLKRREK